MKKSDEDNEHYLEITKMEKPKQMQKKMTTWVSSSFDDFTSTFSKPVKTPLKSSISQPASCSSSKLKKTGLSQSAFSSSLNKGTSYKRPRMHSETPSFDSEKIIDSNLWAEVYRPSNRVDLAVHKKKIEEIYDWLSQKLLKKHGVPILVLSGPPGAGKTVCVHVLCQELGVALQQWQNASNLQTSEDFNSSVKQEYSKVDVYTSQSQGTQFNHFLLRANKYRPLIGTEGSSSNSQGDCHNTTNSKKTVILVEELPNVFNRDPEQIHTILRKYYRSGKSPLVFIVTEFNSSGGSLQKLFPKDLQRELNITHINVNPVAPTMMMKCLKRVISLNSKHKSFFAPSQTVLEMIAQGCAGDLRAAFNMLQFACSKRDSSTHDILKESGSRLQKKGSVTSKPKGGHSKWKRSSSDETESLISVKDTSVFLFHAVGKILYFKRGNPADFPNHSRLPAHLSQHKRDPLLLDPEEVVAKVHISGDMFSSFLHENYVHFMDSVEDLEKATEYFSHADCISSLWTGKEALENYSLSLTTRGFIHSNAGMSRHDSVRKNHGWRPLHKSQWFPTVKQTSQNIASARQLFRGCHWEPEILCTELIPYIHITNPTLHDPGQISFVHQMTQFSQRSNTFRSNMEQLNEKDAIDDPEEEEEEERETTTTTPTTTTTTPGPVERVADQGKASNAKDTSAVNDLHDVDMDMWGSDWEADDEDLLGSQNNVKVPSEEDEIDFVIEDFDD